VLELPAAGTLAWAIPDAFDIQRLRRQCAARSRPLLVDIDGPDAADTAGEFHAVCTAAGTTLLLLHCAGRIRGYLVQRQLDPVTSLATVDFDVFDDDADARAERSLADSVALLQYTQSLARLQMFVLANDARQLARAESLGFRREGVLRRQFRHRGENRDLVVLGRLADGAAAAAHPPDGARPLRIERGAAIAQRWLRRRHTFDVRPVTAADRATLSAWFEDPELQSILDDAALTADGVREKVATLLPSAAPQPRALGFLLLAAGRPVGLLHLLFVNWRSGTAEVDLFLAGADVRDSPLGGAALMAAGTVVFEQLHLQKVYAFVYEDNLRSVRTLTAFMTVEARLESYRPGAAGDPQRGREAALICSLTRDDCRDGLLLDADGAHRWHPTPRGEPA
jgi:RimJ/RimL family protein N-acetyltransferase